LQWHKVHKIGTIEKIDPIKKSTTSLLWIYQYLFSYSYRCEVANYRRASLFEELGEVKPSIEVAAKIADILEVSLDFLIGKVTVEVDNQLLKRVIEVQQMDDNDKEHILYTLDALIKNVKLKSIA